MRNNNTGTLCQWATTTPGFCVNAQQQHRGLCVNAQQQHRDFVSMGNNSQLKVHPAQPATLLCVPENK